VSRHANSIARRPTKRNNNTLGYLRSRPLSGAFQIEGYESITPEIRKRLDKISKVTLVEIIKAFIKAFLGRH
jgi:hypothetical protein